MRARKKKSQKLPVVFAGGRGRGMEQVSEEKLCKKKVESEEKYQGGG